MLKTSKSDIYGSILKNRILPMRILIASKFFYMRGGAELVAINTRRMLLEQGHDVRVLAMQYPDNIPLPEQNTFPSEVNLFGSLAGKLKGTLRMMGMGEARKAARKAIQTFRPDVVHMHNVHSYLSPVVAEEARKAGVRVVWTLHDYKPICPAYNCRRADGTVCEDCFTSPGSVLRHRCMKGSLAGSFIGYLEALRWNRKRLEKIVDTYIAPSAFLGQKMIEAGFDKNKVKVLCNFVDPDKMEMLTSAGPATTTPLHGKYFSYVGRLSQEKGVETLLKAAAMSGMPVKIAGGGPLFDALKRTYGHREGVEFLGHLDAHDVAALLRGSLASVLPSEWYENNPLGVIESLSTGTPVIGAEIGGIPELIVRPRDGFTYPSRNVEALAEKMKEAASTPFDRQAIATAAAERFGTEEHYRRLMGIYRGA